MRNFNDSHTIVTSSSTSTAEQGLENMVMWDATCTVTDTTPAAATFVFVSGNNFTATAHGYLVGLKVQTSTTGGLPTGLSTSTNYYIIVIDANTIAFATSQANALAGTAITISGAGTGVQTATPQALAGTLVAQKTNDAGTTWFTLATPTTAATQNLSAASLNYYDNQCGYQGMRFLLTVTGGQATCAVRLNGKG